MLVALDLSSTEQCIIVYTWTMSAWSSRTASREGFALSPLRATTAAASATSRARRPHAPVGSGARASPHRAAATISP